MGIQKQIFDVQTFSAETAELACVHPFGARVRTEAIIPYFYQDTDARVFDVEPAFKCTACGHYVVPDGVLVERRPVISGGQA